MGSRDGVLNGQGQWHLTLHGQLTGSRGDELTELGQDRLYSDWNCCWRGDILTGHG